jgi:hypothetical protein
MRQGQGEQQGAGQEARSGNAEPMAHA